VDASDEGEVKVARVTDQSQKQARRYHREWVTAAFFAVAASIAYLIYVQVQPSLYTELLMTAGSGVGVHRV
jgi:hypothetical protein